MAEDSRYAAKSMDRNTIRGHGSRPGEPGAQGSRLSRIAVGRTGIGISPPRPGQTRSLANLRSSHQTGLFDVGRAMEKLCRKARAVHAHSSAIHRRIRLRLSMNLRKRTQWQNAADHSRIYKKPAVRPRRWWTWHRDEWRLPNIAG